MISAAFELRYICMDHF